ncbi:hypothetical protein [Ovoidimarina sediminis]|uniref:hypothetical protein n=1 Tax=Ovoidimarina sediminis TaxID=3079856 RepID=UPI002931DFC2|nr:hypothetical protein [Rhodophyticola sp. MJ-SS7]
MLSFIGGAALYAHAPGSLVTVGGLNVPIMLFAGASYAIAVFFTACLTTYFLPGLRHLADAVAVMRLVVGLGALTMPGFAHTLIQSPILSATLVVGGAGLLLAALPMARAQGSVAAEALGQVFDWVDEHSLAYQAART